jgi:hypothetical protein
MLKTLLLLLILLLAGFMAFIPHIAYAYPLHVDEWTHLTYTKTISQTGAVTFPDPFTGEGTSAPGIDNVWVGYHVLLAVFQEVTGIDWLLLFRFGPSIVFMLTVLCVYLFANKQGYGLEAAFFTCLIPTTGGLLGLAFMVPMALGLLFIPLSLYIAFHVKSWSSYLLLFVITCFLWVMHPTMAAIQGIVLLPFILITLKGSSGRGLGLLMALLLPVLIALPITINRILPMAGQLLSPKEVFPPPYMDMPAALQIYGFIPLVFCFIGIMYLLKKGGRNNYALLFAIMLLLVVMLAFARFQVGTDTIFVRGITATLLLIGILAGAGLYWLRTQVASARLLDKYKPSFTTYSSGSLCTLSVAVILAIAIPARFNVPYYHMIDSEDYRAFIWIRDNIGPEYETALVDPWKATAFVAITENNVPRRIWESQGPADDIIYEVLSQGCPDTNLFRDNRLSFVYSRLPINNHDLINVRHNVYITNPNISGSYGKEDILQNGNYESVYGKPPEFWSTYSYKCKSTFLFPEPGRNAGSCVAIDILSTEPFNKIAPHAIWMNIVSVQEGTPYQVGGWIKTDNITGQGGAGIFVQWRALGSTWFGAASCLPNIKGTSGWTSYQGVVIAPPGATVCAICPGMVNCSGTAWFDDILFKAE